MKQIKLTILSIIGLVISLTANAQGNQTDTFLTKNGKEVIITPIKHGSMRITFNNLEIQVDPVIALPPTTNYNTFPKADIILVTHEHSDHCYKKAIEQLSKNTTLLITNENSAKILGKGTIMKNGDKKKLNQDILIEAVAAYNYSDGKTHFHPKGRDNGFVLNIDGLRIYIAGDTEDIPEMKKLKKIDVAFLPTNQPYTMTPEQTANAAKMFMPKVLFPYHYSNTPIERVTELLKTSGIDVRIRNYQ
ncbi:MAG: MBL fold metallo-hydrolase [Paludibacteraceae bacterium]|nr:MBL fold metallo-hydrolase [Paludibacteraceae bacterium]